jgi:hypothetical protein
VTILSCRQAPDNTPGQRSKLVSNVTFNEEIGTFASDCAPSRRSNNGAVTSLDVGIGLPTATGARDFIFPDER